MNGKERDVLETVDGERCLAFLSELVRRRSASGSPGEARLARLLVERMAAIGLDAAVQPVGKRRANAIGTWRGSGGGRSLLFDGHLDTNPVGEGWTVDPYAGARDGTFVYGIGVSNTKASDAAFFSAVRTLKESGWTPRGDITLAYVVGELQGGVGTAAALKAGLRADCFICGEPTDLAALTLHAGSFTFVIELTGATRHLSRRGEAVDALAAAAALVPRINRLTFRGAGDDLRRAVNRAHVGVLRASLSRAFEDWRPAQVADFARLAGSARYAPGQDEETVLEDLRAVVAGIEREFPGLRAEVKREEDATGRPVMRPFEAPRDSAVVRALNRAYETVRGRPQPTGAVAPACFYVTDASHLQAAGIREGVVCGPGGRYNTMPDERVEIAEYLDAVKMYLLAIMEICG